MKSARVHSVEAFGPVATLMPYQNPVTTRWRWHGRVKVAWQARW